METAAADPTQTGSIETASVTPSVDFSGHPRAFMADVRAKAPAEVAAAIEQYYSANDGLLWVDANGVTEKARQAIAALAEVASVGLDPADYQVQDPTDTFASVDGVTRQRQLMQFEIELSAAVLTFVQDTPHRSGPDFRVS
jgi:murein L,D-transpeptidase YcbB/YkuD